MVRLRRFDPAVDVLAAAAQRLDITLQGFDRLVVSYSGGKDSTALLHLVRDAQRRAGLEDRVLAVFRDMEFVNDSVLAKVREVAAYPWIDLRWWCLQYPAQTLIAGQPVDMTTWSPEREAAGAWAREQPEGSWDGDGVPFDLARFDTIAAQLAPGRVGICTGLRAAESLVRYRAVVNKISEPWLAKGAAPGVTLVRPMYDWQEMDVLRYLHDQGESLAAVYDAQVWAGKGNLRTASLVAREQMRDLPALRVTDPDAYAALLATWPEVAVMDRYAADLTDPHGLGAPCQSLDDVEEWIYVRYADSAASRSRALDRLDFARTLAARNPAGFPAWWVQHEIGRDGHGKGMMPLPTTHPRYQEAAQ